MKILILGSGGREHALAKAYSKSKKVKKVFVAPGNGLIDYKTSKITSVSTITSTDFEAVLKFVKTQKIKLVDVAQDDPIALGFVDRLIENGIDVFGPTKNASEIEWNKAWAREFMKKYNLPIPEYNQFDNKQDAKVHIMKYPQKALFIKASGLAGGKGAIRANTKEEAYDAIDAMAKFGEAGKIFLIEECLSGEEFSLFALCDGKDYVILGAAQDHKTVFNADVGPNTGGMGCVAPISILNKKILNEVKTKILNPFMKGMQKEKREYKGILYLGGMLIRGSNKYSSSDPAQAGESRSSRQARTIDNIKIIEFNARWGDPEAQVLIPAIKTDYLTLVDGVLKQKLRRIKIKFDNSLRVSVAATARPYPSDISGVLGKEVFGIDKLLKQKNVEIFGAGIKREKNRFFVTAGRVLHVMGAGKNLFDARENVYKACSNIFIDGNNLHYRTDIGWQEQEWLHLER